MLCLLVFGGGRVWAEEVTYTWTYSSSKFTVSSSGTAPAGSSATLTSTYKNANQLTGDNTQTFTLSGFDDCTITGVSINLKRSSSSSAKANITVSANGEQIGSSSSLALTQSQVDYPITVTSTKVGTGKNVVITVNAAANSIYVYNYKITYTAANKTTTTTTFGNGVDNQNFDFTQGDAPFTKTATLSPTGIGSLTYSSSNSAVASVNSSTGEVTIGQAGKATIKAEYAGDANYAKSSAEYTVTVAPKGTPATYTISSITAVSTTGTTPEGSAATYSQTYSSAKGQMTGSNSTTLTLSGYAGCKINCIKLNMKSNSSSGAGTFSAVAGTTTLASIAEATTFNKWFDNTEYTTSYKDVLVTMDNTSYVIGDDENLVINIAATTSSLYINSYTIYYDLAIPAAEKPVITPADGTEFAIAPQQVTITAGSGASIYYTLDGTTPDDTKTLYEGAFDISATTTVKAIAYETDKRPSAVVSATLAYVPNYDINCNAPEGGSYTVKVANNEAQTITESTTISGGQGKTITLTTTPSAGYKLASTPFTVSDAEDVDVKVSKDGDNYTFTMPSKAVTITANYSRIYTITAGAFEHGEITAIKDKDGASITETSKGSKVVVEASADSHWNLASMYYVKEGEETQNAITETEGVYSFTMPQSNVTVYATYTEDPKYNVSWVVNGTEVKTENVYGDVAVSSPSVEPIAGNVFRGWVETEIDGTLPTAPSYTDVSSLTVSEDKNFYAVFAKGSDSSTDVDITMNATSTTQSGVTITCEKGSGTSDPAWTSNECRVYGSNTITISASSDITAFTLTFHKQGSKDYLSMTANIGTYTSGGVSISGEDNKIDTWTGSANSIILTAGNSGQRVLVGGTITVGSTTYSDYCTFVGYTRAISNALGTICLPCGVDMSNVEDVKFYTVDSKKLDANGDAESVVFAEVEGNLEAGVPYIFVAETTPSTIALPYTGNTVDAPVAGANGLYGAFVNTNLSDIYANGGANDFYLITNNTIKAAYIEDSYIGANRSYLRMKEVPVFGAAPASSKMLVVGKDGFSFEDNGTITLIDTIATEKSGNEIFNLQGQRMNRLQKGVNIVNGKKVIR